MEFYFGKNPSNDAVSVVLSEQEQDFIEFKQSKKHLVIGVGKFKDISRRKLILIVRRIIFSAKSHKARKLAIDFKDFNFRHLKMGKGEVAELLGANMEIANYEYTSFKEQPREGWNFIDSVFISGTDRNIQRRFNRARLIGRQVNECRDLANTPSSDMTPAILADRVRQMCRGLKIRVKVLDADDIKILKMEGVLGVGRGSANEPKFIVMEYFGNAPRGAHGASRKKDNPIVLVGKGVTFDTGGISIKPSQGAFLNEMHMDMAGGAAVISALIGCARLKVKKNVIALIPAVENMPSGSSYKPADILRTMSGATVEVVDTDAEGRIILADALTYARRYNPRLVIDVATLTGASVVALGQRAAAVFTKNEKLEHKIRDIGEYVGEYLWPLPLWEEYEEDIKGTFGDWANLAKNPRFGGAITAAVFLGQFTKDFLWAHLDIAPTMATIEGQYLSKGASGVPVQTLIKLIEDI